MPKAITTTRAGVVATEPVSPIAAIGEQANRAAAAHMFGEYRARRAAHTLRRQDADLALFEQFLHSTGATVGDLACDVDAWAGVSWGLVAAFVRWQLLQGYAIGSVNVRLATVKAYAKLAMYAGVIPVGEYAMIKTVGGYRHAEGRNLDATRAITRKSTKKAMSATLTSAQAAQLKQQPHTAQGRRDTLLLCLLLDHGLRVGELAALTVEAIDLSTGTFTFYRPKVHKTQTHKLSADALRAAFAYVRHDAPTSGPLLLGSRKDGSLQGTMSERAITERVRVLGRLVGVDGLSPHDLRHHWATVAMRNGTDVKSLQDAGGWSSPAMPLRYAESAAIANQGVKLDL